jgi:hypothetical protein
VKQWFFGCFKLKQVEIIVGNDEYSRKLSSVMLGNPQIEIHHYWSMEKTEQDAAAQLGFDAPKCFQMLARLRNQQELLEVFGVFAQKLLYGENAN